MKNKIFVGLFLGSIVLTSPIMIKKILPDSMIASYVASEEMLTLASKEAGNKLVTSVVPTAEAVTIGTKDEGTKVEDGQPKVEEEIKQEKTENETNIELEVRAQSFEKQSEEIILEENELVDNVTKKDTDNPYFADALFIGDSRTEGIEAFGGIKNATFFCKTGLSVYNLSSTKVNMAGLGKVSLDELLEERQFGKVYILLGINELGNNLETTVTKYSEIIEKVQATQADNTVIYVQANMHVTQKKSNSSKFTNDRINQLNSMLAGLEDGENIVYIDVNEKFDDENGNLPANYTQDGIHIYAKYYKDWTAWIAENVVV